MTYNTMPTYLPNANASEVIGHRLVGVDQNFEQSDAGIWYGWNFYRLDSEVVITLGFEDEDGNSLFDAAKPLEFVRPTGVINERIESAWQLPDDFDYSPYALRMASGLYVVELLHALEGLGPPGVCVLNQDDLSWELTRLW